MNKIILMMIAALLVSCHSETSIPYRTEIEALPKLLEEYMISGGVVGDGGDPGKFYLLSKQVAVAGTQDQFNTMLQDPCPAVRAMGLVCLAKHKFDYDILYGDESKIIATPLGCCGSHMTLEEFSKKLKQDYGFRICYTDETGELVGEYYK